MNPCINQLNSFFVRCHADQCYSDVGGFQPSAPAAWKELVLPCKGTIGLQLRKGDGQGFSMFLSCVWMVVLEQAGSLGGDLPGSWALHRPMPMFDRWFDHIFGYSRPGRTVFGPTWPCRAPVPMPWFKRFCTHQHTLEDSYGSLSTCGLMNWISPFSPCVLGEPVFFPFTRSQPRSWTLQAFVTSPSPCWAPGCWATGASRSLARPLARAPLWRSRPRPRWKTPLVRRFRRPRPRLGCRRMKLAQWPESWTSIVWLRIFHYKTRSSIL